jgi:hypothetical protein
MTGYTSSNRRAAKSFTFSTDPNTRSQKEPAAAGLFARVQSGLQRRIVPGRKRAELRHSRAQQGVMPSMIKRPTWPNRSASPRRLSRCRPTRRRSSCTSLASSSSTATRAQRASEIVGRRGGRHGHRHDRVRRQIEGARKWPYHSARSAAAPQQTGWAAASGAATHP